MTIYVSTFYDRFKENRGMANIQELKTEIYLVYQRSCNEAIHKTEFHNKLTGGFMEKNVSLQKLARKWPSSIVARTEIKVV